MVRGASSGRLPETGVGPRSLRAGGSDRVAPGAAGLHGDGGHNRAAAGHVVEERGRAEAALAFAASIVESSDDAIIGQTLDGIITTWNEGAGRVYGYAASEMIGQPISIIIPPELGEESPRILEQVRQGRHVDNYETVRVAKDRRPIGVSVTVSPVRDARGRIVGASSIARDITHRKEAEAAVRERDILRYIASLAAAVSHEINNPLAVVMGYTQLLADEMDAKGYGRVDEMLKAISRIQEVVIRMNLVTRVALSHDAPYLPEMLDLRGSSEPGAPLQ